jgi:hypothetical protein
MRRLDWALLLAVGVLSSAWCLTAGWQLGPTADEPFYLDAGLEFWRTGKPEKLHLAGTMPLAPHLQTLPLYLTELATGHRWVWADDVAPMITIARAVTLVFWWLLLAYTLLLGHALGGPWAGRLAVLLVALEPSLLAHAALATTDVALAACLLVFVYHFRAGRELGWGWRVGLPTVLFAVALLAKASTLVFAPLAMLAIELERLGRDGTLAKAWQTGWLGRLGNLWKASRRLRWDGVFVVVVGLILAVVYCRTGSNPMPSLQRLRDSLPADPVFRPLVAWAAELPLAPSALHAIWYQVQHNRTGHGTYLVGYESPTWLWFYFPVLLTIKTPAAILLLLALTLLFPGQRLNLALALAGVLLLFSFTMHVQIGIRFLLPLLAFLIVGLAVRAVAVLAELPAKSRWAGVGLVAASLGWLLVSDARLWPDSLRYTNELWGGTERGYTLVSDSNYDWGQGLPELAAWHQQHEGRLAVMYFGADPRFLELPRFWPGTDESNQAALQGGRLAVSATWLYGGYLEEGLARDLMLRLRQRQPTGRTRTFLIYDEVTP